jgi:hypothetical protein
MKEMKGKEKTIVEKFYSSQSKEYRDELDMLVRRLLKKHNLRLILNQTIYHKEFQKAGPAVSCNIYYCYE